MNSFSLFTTLSMMDFCKISFKCPSAKKAILYIFTGENPS